MDAQQAAAVAHLSFDRSLPTLQESSAVVLSVVEKFELGRIKCRIIMFELGKNKQLISNFNYL